MSATAYVTIINKTGFELNLIKETSGVNQVWYNVQDTILKNSTTGRAKLDSASSHERGDLYYENQANDGTIDLHLSHRKSRNKVSVSADSNTVVFRTKIGNGAWSDYGTVVQGVGDFHVEYTIS